MPTPRALHEKLSLSELLKKLMGEGIELVGAELDLARAEAGGIARLYVLGTIICLTGFVMGIGTVVMLAQAAALGLAMYVGSVPLAYLIIGLVMLILTVCLVLLGASFFTRKYQPVGAVFRWLTGQRASP